MIRRVAVVLAAVALAGCGTPVTQPAPTPTMPLPSSPPALTSYYHQKLAWRACGADQCADLSVPLDYAHPSARSIKLSVLRAPATKPSEKIGDLVVNPGGPGASGVDFAAQGALGYFRPALTEHFDIVGFDPRGVSAKAAINCGNTAQTDALAETNPSPRTPAEWQSVIAVAKAYMQRCQTLSGPLAGHVSTVEAAKDIDILRAALGQPRLYYFGASYGTFLGATYAGLFPHNVGRMVLDGALDPALSSKVMTLQQAHSLEVALRSYVAGCVATKGCPLGTSVSAGVARVQRLLAQIAASPLPTGTSRPLDEALALYAVWAPLYVKANWPQLTSALTEAIDQGRGSQMLQLADASIGRGATRSDDNALAAQNAINCLDHDDPVPWQQVERLVPEFEKASPTFGRVFASMLPSCSFYPVQDHHRTSAIRAQGAVPIVVIGTTRDPVTPLAWARALAGQLASGVLVTRNGDGHTAYSEGNGCINTLVERYFVAGVVPRSGTAC
ncbi:MAG: alpha/beta hydrolase [Marmoricola sp.]